MEVFYRFLSIPERVEGFLQNLALCQKNRDIRISMHVHCSRENLINYTGEGRISIQILDVPYVGFLTTTPIVTKTIRFHTSYECLGDFNLFQ